MQKYNGSKNKEEMMESYEDTIKETRRIKKRSAREKRYLASMDMVHRGKFNTLREKRKSGYTIEEEFLPYDTNEEVEELD